MCGELLNDGMVCGGFDLSSLLVVITTASMPSDVFAERVVLLASKII